MTVQRLPQQQQQQ